MRTSQESVQAPVDDLQFEVRQLLDYQIELRIGYRGGCKLELLFTETRAMWLVDQLVGLIDPPVADTVAHAEFSAMCQNLKRLLDKREE